MSSHDLPNLFQAMKLLDDDRLRELCLHLNVANEDLAQLDYNNDLPLNGTFVGRVYTLIDYCKRHIAIDTLVETLKKHYPYLLKPDTPHQLPSCYETPPSREDLIPRDEEIDKLRSKWGKHPAAGIVGIGGQGKTSFASLFVRAWIGPVYWANVNHGGDQIIICALTIMGVEFDRKDYPKLGALSHLLVNTLRRNDEPWLIVIDDFEPRHLANGDYPIDGEMAELLYLACKEGLGHSRLLLTARVMPRCKGVDQPIGYHLDGLKPGQALALITNLLPENCPSEELVLRVAGKKYTDGNPYALILLANYLKRKQGNPNRNLEKLLEDEGLWENTTGELLDKVWKQMPLNQKQVAQYISIFPTHVTAEVIAGMLARLPKPLTVDQSGLDGLVESSLAKLDYDEQYELHPLLHRYAHRKIVPDASAYHYAAARYYLNQYTCDTRANPPQSVADVQLLLTAFDQLCAAAEYSKALGLLYRAIEDREERLDLYEKLDRWGEYQRLLVMQKCIAKSPVSALNKRERSKTMSGLGKVHKDLGDYQQALDYIRQSLQIDEQTGDIKNKGADLGSLGQTYSSLGEYEQAIDCYLQGLEIAEQTGDLKNKGVHLGNLGVAYDWLKDFQQAIVYHHQALEIAEQTGNIRGKGNHLGNLGYSYIKNGEIEKGIGYCEQAEQISSRLNDIRSQGHLWHNLGEGYTALHRPVDALACFLKAQFFHERSLQPDKETTRKNIAKLREEVGDDEWPALEAQARQLADDPNWRPWNDEQET